MKSTPLVAVYFWNLFFVVVSKLQKHGQDEYRWELGRGGWSLMGRTGGDSGRREEGWDREDTGKGGRGQEGETAEDENY